MPPMFKTIFKKNIVFLSDARFIGDLLPHIEIGTSYVQGSFVLIAFIIYIPLLLTVSKLSIPIAFIVDKFWTVDIYRWRRIQGLLFALFATCLAIISIYLFNETTLIDAFFTFIAFVVIAIAFASGGRR